MTSPRPVNPSPIPPTSNDDPMLLVDRAVTLRARLLAVQARQAALQDALTQVLTELTSEQVSIYQDYLRKLFR